MVSFISLCPDLPPVSLGFHEAALLLFVRTPHRSSPDTVRFVCCGSQAALPPLPGWKALTLQVKEILP